MGGVWKNEIEISKKIYLYELMEDYYLFYLDLMFNLYFICDLVVSVGDGLMINKMRELVCRCELLFMEYIIKYYLRFVKYNVLIWLDCDYKFLIEGGDELILNEEIIVIGVFVCILVKVIECLVKNFFS